MKKTPSPKSLTLAFGQNAEPLLKNGVADCLRISDMLRRDMVPLGQRMMAVNIAESIRTLGTLMTYIDFDRKQPELEGKIAVCLFEICVSARILGANKILLPVNKQNPMAAYIEKALDSSGLQLKRLSFRSTPYATDFTAYPIVDRSSKNNSLNKNPRSLAHVANLWMISDRLKQKWAQEGRQPASKITLGR